MRKSFAIFFVLSLSITIYLTQPQQIKAQTTCASGEVLVGTDCRKVMGLFGQRTLKDTSVETLDEYGIDHASGVTIDTSVSPNKVYVIDAGNSRILGYKSLGSCTGTTTACTNNSDCTAGAECVLNPAKKPDIIIGQASGVTGACNRDNNLGIYTAPLANSLCLMPFPQGTNTAENWMRINMATDNSGNLYVPDVDNNRVLVYKSPLGTTNAGAGDNRADVVLGQKSFTSNSVNLGNGQNGPRQNSLFISHGFGMGYDHISNRSVSVNKATGDIWVADTLNHRVLRFPSSCLTKNTGCSANLVLGQASFTSVDWTACGIQSDTQSTNRFCTPTNARVNPETGELFVVDEHPTGFRARILVFKAPFTNGMSPNRVIDTSKPGYHIDGQQEFQVTGISFNENKSKYPANDARRLGELWITENSLRRVLLIDADGSSADGYTDGDIISVIGSTDKMVRGCNYKMIGDCNQGPPEKDYNLCWTGGNLSFDSAGNVFLPDENWRRVSIVNEVTYKPYTYNNPTVGPVQCVPAPTNGMYPGTRPNSIGAYGTTGGVGMFAFQAGTTNQLIIRDSWRFLVWNNYLTKGIGKVADFAVGQPSLTVKTNNDQAIGARSFFTKDARNRLWTLNEHGFLVVYQLPLTATSQPIANFIPVYWPDDLANPVRLEGGIGIAYHAPTDSLLVSSSISHRIIAIKNISQYTDFTNQKLKIDVVFGQPNKGSTGCNFNQPEGQNPTASSLCVPTQIALDKQNNLYVVENAYECHGNNRITMFENTDITAALSASASAPPSASFPLTAAKKVFNKPDFTTAGNAPGSCAYNRTDGPGSPVSVAFDATNRMVVGNDGYLGDVTIRQKRQLWLYTDPLKKDTQGKYIQNQPADAYITVPTGAAGDLWFDAQNNFIMQDHTWNRAWMINFATDPRWITTFP